MKQGVFLICSLFLFSACNNTKRLAQSYDSETLEIIKLSDKVFLHKTYLSIPNYGNFPCNGMIVMDGGEAIVFDTPSENEVAIELINWIERTKKHKLKAVVINHFHDDCLGGLSAFHERAIPSYANSLTCTLAKADSLTIPQRSFEKTLTLKAGDTAVQNTYFGEAHSRDNIVSYIPSEKTLFGGCMLKSVNARKGNLKDANTSTWANTIQQVKTAYPDLKYAIPGHGQFGGMELLDYTIALFQEK